MITTQDIDRARVALTVLSTAPNKLSNSNGMEQDRDIIKAMAEQFQKTLFRLIEDCGGDSTYLDTTCGDINDAIDNAFHEAITAAEERTEARRSKVERELAKADAIYEAGR